MNNLRQHLLEEMETIHTVDCHSHTDSPKVYYENSPYDVFSLMSYFNREIQAITGKTSQELFGNVIPDADRWEILRNIIARTRNISYWRHNMVVYRHLFNFQHSELNDHNWRARAKASANPFLPKFLLPRMQTTPRSPVE